MKVGIIGAGNLGQRVIEAVIEDFDVMASRTSEAGLEELRNKFPNVETTLDNKEIVDFSDVLVLGVKPRHVEGVCSEIKDCLSDELVVSLAAGVSLKELKDYLSYERVARVMTGLFVKDELVCYSMNQSVEDEEVMKEVFGTNAERVPEEALSARAFIGCMTGIFPMLIEEMCVELESYGMSEETARKSFAGTLKGLAKELESFTGKEIFDSVTGGSEEAFTARLYESLKEKGLVDVLLEELKETVEKC